MDLKIEEYLEEEQSHIKNPEEKWNTKAITLTKEGIYEFTYSWVEFVEEDNVGMGEVDPALEIKSP